MKFTSRGMASRLLIGVLAGGAAIGGLLSARAGSSRTPTTPQVFATLLHRLGLEPQAMAAAGLTAAQTQSVLTRLRDASGESVTTLANADEAYGTAYSERDRLVGLIQSGTGTQDDIAALAAVDASILQAAATRASWLQSTLTQAAEGVNQDALVILRRLHESPRFEDAVEFGVAARDQDAWVRLRDALSAQQLADRSGEAVVPAVENIISIARSDAAVSAARVNLDANAASVALAWDTAVYGR